ncbi:MAG TPA: hypothetical protein VFB77_00250 [Acidimicrobiales bacterium]|nr:hypothetical protein [Acidimicrobiales bacterium]
MPYYEFTLVGDADPAAVERATGLHCTPAGLGVRADGELVDRAALHGIIERMYRLGLDLISVERRSARHVP